MVSENGKQMKTIWILSDICRRCCQPLQQRKRRNAVVGTCCAHIKIARSLFLSATFRRLRIACWNWAKATPPLIFHPLSFDLGFTPRGKLSMSFYGCCTSQHLLQDILENLRGGRCWGRCAMFAIKTYAFSDKLICQGGKLCFFNILSMHWLHVHSKTPTTWKHFLRVVKNYKEWVMDFSVNTRKSKTDRLFLPKIYMLFQPLPELNS